MATYENPTGHVTGTSDADIFRYNAPLAASATVDGEGGVDQLIVDRGSDQASSFRAHDSFNDGTFSGTVQYGPYDPRITFFDIEELAFTGSGFNDLFDIKVGTASSARPMNVDGAAGIDTTDPRLSDTDVGDRLSRRQRYDHQQLRHVRHLEKFHDHRRFGRRHHPYGRPERHHLRLWRLGRDPHRPWR